MIPTEIFKNHERKYRDQLNKLSNDGATDVEFHYICGDIIHGREGKVITTYKDKDDKRCHMNEIQLEKYS